MIKKLALLSVFGLLTTCLVSCGEPSKPATGTTPASTAGKSEGQDLAKKILATYDEAVAETAKLANEKPESAELKPKVEQIIATYSAKMAELNVEYRALKTKDVASFGQANTYMGDNRGKHVSNADNSLTVALKYYNLEKGDKEMVELLTTKLVALIDIAVSATAGLPPHSCKWGAVAGAACAERFRHFALIQGD
jgi:hypothetical protein